MATIYDLKPRFQNLLRPLVQKLARKGVTANQVTIAAAILSALTGGIVLFLPIRHWSLLLVPIVLFVRMALNAIDGMLAREHAMQSHLGAILNELGDVLSDAALYLPLAVIDGLPGWLVIIVVVLAICIEMNGVVAVQIGASRRYDGPFGKSDRAFLFGLLSLLLGVGLSPGWWSNALLAIMLVLAILTMRNRSIRALREVADDAAK
ncbi:CDP-alcohol phosphatidyltransferase family protein [uncultured Desulfuromonas sp.]|uniref:CDP-alcohol phosphatidyltransferase family protein n=1 Tax=uncultured Desulfuromonas sp. TaxID=181013 RepID=UPI002AAB0AF8|nr:CDP-alcohol phosphatidyltransferase family protein [uncultured Desulfuromonas sp.]